MTACIVLGMGRPTGRYGGLSIGCAQGGPSAPVGRVRTMSDIGESAIALRLVHESDLDLLF
jgi:hypothetical protein